MKLKIIRPIIFFDIESTGLDVSKDRIVEISILKVFPDEHEEIKTLRVNPTIPIPATSSKIHGIKDADVKDAPPFSEVAHSVANFIRGCDIAGYNATKFDIPLLAEEFIRADVDLDLKKSKFVDVQTIFFKMEQRTLGAAYQFYCHKELTNAHGAEADAIATYEVLQSQLEMYEDLKNDVNFLANFTSQTRNADFAGRIVLNEKGVEVFNFGKYKGKTVEEVFLSDTGYYNWMMNSDFPLYTKKILTSIKLRMAFKSNSK
jgi:DNA polymerase-3 subunit epsilon